MGPLSLTPVLSAMSRISVHIELMSWGLVLESRILAFETIPGHLDLQFCSGEGDGWGVVLKRISVGVGLGPCSSGESLAFLDYLFDNTNGDGAAHVPYSEPSKLWNILEAFDHHRSQRSHLHQSTVSNFQKARLLLDHLTSPRVDLSNQFLKSDSDRGGVSMEDWCVSGRDGCWMVYDDDLAYECLGYGWWLVWVPHNFTASNILLRNTFDVESNIVAGFSLWHPDMVRLDRLDLTNLVRWHENDLVVLLQNSRLDASNRDDSNARDCVNILYWNA